MPKDLPTAGAICLCHVDEGAVRQLDARVCIDDAWNKTAEEDNERFRFESDAEKHDRDRDPRHGGMGRMTSKTGFTKRSTPVYHPMNSPSTVPSTTARTKPTDATVMLERMFIPSVEPSGFGSVIFSAKVCRICTGDGKYRVEIRPHSTTSAQTAINSTTVRADAIAKRFLLKSFLFSWHLSAVSGRRVRRSPPKSEQLPRSQTMRRSHCAVRSSAYRLLRQAGAGSP